MNETSIADFATLLSVMTALTGVLTAHVGLGWLARAQRRPALLQSWSSQLLAAASLGTGVSAMGLLGLLAEGLTFPIGYGAVAALVLWLGAVIASLLLVGGLTWRLNRWTVALAGLVLAGLGTLAQVGWVWAAGFRPGVLWDWRLVAASAVLPLVGAWVALTMSAGQRSRRRRLEQPWQRRGASLLLGASLLAGQQVVLAGADLDSQRGSVYRNQVPGSIAGVGGAVLVPMTLLTMALDLSLRNAGGRHSHAGVVPQQRRKRRHRVRML